MRPYFAVMQLRGNMLQSKRFKIYEKFSQTPRGAVLLATNVAERGLGKLVHLNFTMHVFRPSAYSK